MSARADLLPFSSSADGLFYAQHPFRDPNEFAALKAELPDFTTAPHFFRSDRDLHYWDPSFVEMRKSSVWKNFCGSLSTKEFWSPYLEHFSGYFGELKCDPRELQIDSFVEDPIGRRPEATNLYLYPRIDIGYGGVGYGLHNGGRGVHIDRPQRLISIMFYFTGQDGMEGGEFEIYRDPHSLLKRIPLQENLAIISFQTKDAWHAVNPVRSIKYKRVAAYIALSSSQMLWRER